jgi:hypothetical protein
VKIQPQWVAMPGKQTNKQTNKYYELNMLMKELVVDLNKQCQQYVVEK